MARFHLFSGWLATTTHYRKLTAEQMAAECRRLLPQCVISHTPTRITVLWEAGGGGGEKQLA